MGHEPMSHRENNNLSAEPKPADASDELYSHVLTGGMGVHLMCRRCGALIADMVMEEGAVTPRVAHSKWHEIINILLKVARDEA